MIVESLSLDGFRLLRRASVELAPGANLFLGRNAQGKTTILEALSVLSTGRSFRTARDREILFRGESPEGERPTYAAAECRFLRRDGRHSLRAALTQKARSVWLDGKLVARLGDLWGNLVTVTFLPEHLGLVRGAPAARRLFLDNLLLLSDRPSLEAMQRYDKALRHRNVLLRRGGAHDARQLASFEGELALHGARLMLARRRLVEALRRPLGEALFAMTGSREELQVRHEEGFPEASGIARALVESDVEGVPALVDLLADYWQRTRQADVDFRVTRHGPHRADLALVLDGLDARNYASQGQARSIVLALRLAELELLRERYGEPPVLLLDDVLGELDRDRARRFVRLVAQRGVQALLTATDATLIEEELPIGARFTVEAGEVRRA